MAMDAENKRQMDMAAEEARTSLKQLIKEGAVTEEQLMHLHNWFQRFVGKAGWKRLAKLITLVAAVVTVGCAQAPICSIDNIYIYDAGVCLEAYAEAMDEEECFTDTCCEMREMDEMAYHQATGRVWQ